MKIIVTLDSGLTFSAEDIFEVDEENNRLTYLIGNAKITAPITRSETKLLHRIEVTRAYYLCDEFEDIEYGGGVTLSKANELLGLPTRIQDDELDDLPF